MDAGDERKTRLADMLHSRKRLQGILFGLLLVPVAAYFIVPHAMILLAGGLYLAACWILLAANNKSIRTLYGELEQTGLDWLRRFLAAAGRTPPEGGLAYGYLQTVESVFPVLLFVERGGLAVFDNPLRRRCLYAVENDFCYVLEPADKCPAVDRAELSLSSCCFRPGPLRHQDFLLERRRATGNVAAVEIFVYDQLLSEAQAGNPAPFINCAHALGKKKKERVFAIELPQGGILHIPEPAFARLSLPRDACIPNPL